MMNPFSISLIISTYNNPRFLELVLISVLKQKLLPQELVIADDGSGEETKELIEIYKKIFPIPLLHVWHEDKGYRLSSIKNKAVAIAASEYVIFIDGDLLLHPLFIFDYQKSIHRGYILVASRAFLSKSFTQVLLNQKNCVVNFHRGNFDQNMASAARIPWLHHLIKGSTTYKGARGGLMGFFKKDYVSVNGLDEAFIGWGREDSDLFVRLLNSGIKRKNIKFAAITYHLWHPILSRDSLSTNDALLQKSIDAQSKWCKKGVDQYLGIQSS